MDDLLGTDLDSTPRTDPADDGLPHEPEFYIGPDEEDAGDLDRLWDALGTAFAALRSIDDAQVEALADELNFGELADLFLDCMNATDRIKAIEGRAKALLTDEALRRYKTDGTKTAWSRDGGTVSLAVPDKPSIVVESEEVVLAWAREHMPTWVDESPRLHPSALSAIDTIGTVNGDGVYLTDKVADPALAGAQVEGLTVQPPGSPYLSRRRAK